MTHPPRTGQHRPPLTVTDAGASRYLLLRTFRADGTGVDTPIWSVVEGTTLWFRTPTDSAKVRRILRDPAVELRRCTWKGTQRSDAVLTGRAFVADGAAARHAYARLAQRYGWQWNIVPMIPVPGVRSAYRHLGLRARWRMATPTELWPNSSIIGVELVDPSPKRDQSVWPVPVSPTPARGDR